VLRKIFGLKRRRQKGEWRKLHIIRKIKSRRRRRAWHDIPGREEKRIQDLRKKNKARDHLEDKHVVARMLTLIVLMWRIG